MKLHFEPDLDYQLQAIEAVCDVFRGQELCRTEFTVSRDPTDTQLRMGFHQSDLGIGNRLTLLDDELLKNVREIQLRNGLAESNSLSSGDFTVEMETGTGKTYVYLRTIFELNKRFGFTKFMIVVPSVAIKEGVYKSLQLTKDHIHSLYAGVPYGYFLYDSSRMEDVRNFATSAHVQIMVATVGAINKRDVNNLYKDSEKTGGEKPVDLIRATRPIVIVDEPQTVDGGLNGAGKKALEDMHPLCTLRYSATHVDKHHMLYQLDAVDAYERKLVKQIEVAGATIENAHNRPFVRLVAVSRSRRALSATLELDVDTATGVQRKEIIVQDGDDLEQTTGRALYAGCRVGEIRVDPTNPFVELRYPGGDAYLKPGEAWGDVDPVAVQREMIRRTVKEHLDKQKRLQPLGIKVLSLFFIEQVSRYRSYGAGGATVKEVYAKIFEEEYVRWARHPDYEELFRGVNVELAAQEVHGGYFSIDKKGQWVNTDEGTRQEGRDDAERAYRLIMREKETLLGFDTPLQFIFSHSALKEGWDNPNVFQICTLRDMRSETERRQSIGRGLRICVDQTGQRVRGFDINTLTVVANESYESFAENLQKEMATSGTRFGVVEMHDFARVVVQQPDGTMTPLGVTRSSALWEHLKTVGHLDDAGRVQDLLRDALKSGAFIVPEPYKGQQDQIEQVLRKRAGRLEVRNADERRRVNVNKKVLLREDFRALWDRIKHKTVYRVQFDNEALVTLCAKTLKEAPPIPRSRLQWRKADLAIGKAGVDAEEKPGATPVALKESHLPLPDILTDLQDRTALTRRSIHRILVMSGRLDEFAHNPQGFSALAADTINRCKRMSLVDGIKYQRLGDAHFFAQELFESEELVGYLRSMRESAKSVYEKVIHDSGVERAFAEALENNTAVKVYAKLPGWFVVPTPLGDYNPDWAVLVQHDGADRLYFVVETKSSALLADEARRGIENGKIHCGKVHFASLAGNQDHATYIVASAVNDLLDQSLPSCADE